MPGRSASEAALVRIEELRVEVAGHAPMLDQLKERYEHRGEHFVHEHQEDGSPGSDELTPEEVEEREHDEIRRSIIARRAPGHPPPARSRGDQR